MLQCWYKKQLEIDRLDERVNNFYYSRFILVVNHFKLVHKKFQMQYLPKFHLNFFFEFERNTKDICMMFSCVVIHFSSISPQRNTKFAFLLSMTYIKLVRIALYMCFDFCCMRVFTINTQVKEIAGKERWFQ